MCKTRKKLLIHLLENTKITNEWCCAVCTKNAFSFVLCVVVPRRVGLDLRQVYPDCSNCTGCRQTVTTHAHISCLHPISNVREFSVILRRDICHGFWGNPLPQVLVYSLTHANSMLTHMTLYVCYVTWKVWLSESFVQFQGKEGERKHVWCSAASPHSEEGLCIASAYCTASLKPEAALVCVWMRLEGGWFLTSPWREKGCPHKQPPQANALNSQIHRLYFSLLQSLTPLSSFPWNARAPLFLSK